MNYQVELVWNREFDWSPFGDPHTTLDTAIAAAKSAEAMGNGERVKKTRVINSEGKVVWAYGKKVA